MVLTLEGYFIVTGAQLEKQPEIPSDLRAHLRLDRKNNYIVISHAMVTKSLTSTERVVNLT